MKKKSDCFLLPMPSLFPGEVHLHLRILQLGGSAIDGCSDERVLVLEDTQGDGENLF